jgi:hypothetical protein
MYKKLISKYDYYFPDRREYYKRYLYPRTVDTFIDLWEKENKFFIHRPVIFRGIDFGENTKTILSKLGKPRVEMKEPRLFSYVYFYREKIYSPRDIVQIHFHRGKFFCAVCTFRHESAEQWQIIKNILYEKYAGADAEKASAHSLLSDTDGNLLYIREDVVLHVVYLWGNAAIKSFYSGHKKSVHEQKQKHFSDLQHALLEKL